MSVRHNICLFNPFIFINVVLIITKKYILKFNQFSEYRECHNWLWWINSLNFVIFGFSENAM